MSRYYDKWDFYDSVYRGESQPDEADKKAVDRKEPTKMIVPLTYAQVQTFVAFAFSLFYQRDNFFELTGMGPEDTEPARLGERVLSRDLDYNIWDAKLYQFLLDMARFGVGIMKVGWIHRKRRGLATQAVGATRLAGIEIPTSAKTIVETDMTEYQGNQITSISPYRFYPDPRMPLDRFQEGEFCGSEDEFTKVQLLQMQKDGEVTGIEHIEGLTREMMDKRGSSRLHSFMPTETDGKNSSEGNQSLGTIIIDEMQVRLVPNQFMVDGKPMGKEDFPVLYNVWIANDNKIVKAEPLEYLHDKFTYNLGQYTPDQHKQVNAGISEGIDALQSVISWLINSHITSVRKVIQNFLVVDPDGVEISDLIERRPVIRLKRQSGAKGIDRFVKQLEVRDVTQSHMADAKVLQDLVQTVTGVSDNALGQFSPGRRSATENRNVNSSTASRLKMILQVVWKSCLAPMGKQMISNLQDGLDEETLVRVEGSAADPADFQAFKGITQADIIGNFDFRLFDGTLPSEKIAQSTALQELSALMLAQPALIQLLGYDIRAIIDETLTLRGIKRLERFRLQQSTQTADAGPPIDPNAVSEGGIEQLIGGPAGGVPTGGI